MRICGRRFVAAGSGLGSNAGQCSPSASRPVRGRPAARRSPVGCTAPEPPVGPILITTGLAAASAAIWLCLILARGRFWLVRVPPPPVAAPSPARIVAVIPARDEAESIGRTVQGLLRQDWPGRLDLIVVDDQSGDGTAALARAAADEIGAADRLTVLSAPARPPGWTGKLWAVAQGVVSARRFTPDFILLTDADIVHEPGNLADLVARARSEDRDLVSQMVLLRAESPAERALIPAFVFFFFMLYPLRWVASPTRRCAAAAGGCMLIRPAALDRIGGIAAIRGALIDDCALAAAVKKTGGRIRLDVTRAARSIRAYDGAGEIWSMIARTAFTQLGYSSLVLAGTLAGLGVTYLAPPLLLACAEGWPRLVGGACWLAMAGAFLPTVRLYRLNPVWSLALPAIALFYSAATIGSAVAFWRGRGGQWKGRAQALGG
jgi:hopene-associated glycosyltransferase HpnB